MMSLLLHDDQIKKKLGVGKYLDINPDFKMISILHKNTLQKLTLSL